MTQIPNKLMYRPDEAAKLLGVHVETIRRWIREEKIVTIKTCDGHNMIHRGEVERMLEGRGND